MKETVDTGNASILTRIRKQEEYIAKYQEKLKETPTDKETAEAIMTLQVSIEELKNNLE